MIHTNNSNIMIAAMWRSGSTHIARNLGQMLGWRPASTSGYHGEGMEQQDINQFSAAILFPYGYQVFHQHVWGSKRNIDLLKAFQVKTVVCYRNIPDTILSIRDRLERLPSFVIPGLPLYQKWWDMPKEKQYDWLAYHVTPWQCQFYNTWKRADMDKYMVKYSAFYADQQKGFYDLLTWLDVPMDKLGISLPEAARSEHNLVTGRAGRGKVELPQSTQNIIADIVRSWGWEEMERELL